jgi:hypothetical protein
MRIAVLSMLGLSRSRRPLPSLDVAPYSVGATMTIGFAMIRSPELRSPPNYSALLQQLLMSLPPQWR